MTIVRLAALSLLLIDQSRAQTGPAITRGACSPANTGNNNTFTFNCGIGKEQGQAILSIVNRILANQIDPAAVIAKLDEIQRGVDELRERTAPRTISDQDFMRAAKLLSRFPKQRVSIAFLNANEESRKLAERIRSMLLLAGWESDSVGTTTPYATGRLPGILIAAKASTEPAEALLNTLGDLGLDIDGRILSGLPPDVIEVNVYAKP